MKYYTYQRIQKEGSLISWITVDSCLQNRVFFVKEAFSHNIKFINGIWQTSF